MDLQALIGVIVKQAEDRLPALKAQATAQIEPQVREIKLALDALASDAKALLKAIQDESDPLARASLMQQAEGTMLRRGGYIAAASVAFAETDAKLAWNTALDVGLKILVGLVKAL